MRKGSRAHCKRQGCIARKGGEGSALCPVKLKKREYGGGVERFTRRHMCTELNKLGTNTCSVPGARAVDDTGVAAATGRGQTRAASWVKNFSYDVSYATFSFRRTLTARCVTRMHLAVFIERQHFESK